MFTIKEIHPSADEISLGAFGSEKLSTAVNAIREDGIVVLADVVSQASIEVLRKRLIEDVELLVNRPDAPYNWTKGNIQQDPPPFEPYLFRDVLVNDLVIQVTKGVLGAGLKNGFYSGNTAMPSESRQPVHADEGQLWPNLVTVPPPNSLVVNLPLVDMGPENGSTEIWPGTHLDPTVTIQSGNIEVPLDKLEQTRKVAPPIQPVVRAGSVVIRDIRLWHAGMPNRTSSPRPMIAMIHVVSWWPTGAVKFAKGSEKYLQHPDLKWHAEYTEGAADYISAVHGHMAESAV
jgi:ectoine hydroxylase-related dioxygenase (phytanoyl-CoA dioxygenase family)